LRRVRVVRVSIGWAGALPRSTLPDREFGAHKRGLGPGSIGSSALIRAPIARSASPATPAIQKGPAFHPGEYLRGQPGHATGADADEFWSIGTVVLKTGLSRASIYRYAARDLFPARRRRGLFSRQLRFPAPMVGLKKSDKARHAVRIHHAPPR
jgi:predicted DNA-binding transcriptional regulator AlpA